MKIEYLDEVDSTNSYIRRYLDVGENVIVCARRQTGGRGTKGRSFCSEEGGVYLSALTFYRDLPVSRAFRIMTHSAVSVCRTAKAFGAEVQIKWPNDVFAAGRKLSGTLIENVFAGDKVRCSIVGIGLNVNNDVSALGGIAVALSELVGRVKTEEVRDEAQEIGETVMAAFAAQQVETPAQPEPPVREERPREKREERRPREKQDRQRPDGQRGQNQK